ncbi:neuroserpin-like [Centruroides sculpturatus]|uniref:neuroserpin-like n=1 Tax=Centruroides sculpturatus TaxID=218467 RepID=UPI000C6E016A|nr:neuroserpin-like [Centruroides sculpturatus]
MNYKEIGNLQETYRRILMKLKRSDDANLTNAIFYQEDYHLSNKYRSIMKRVFNAEIVSMDFRMEKSENYINKWIRNVTNHKIKSIMQDSPTNETLMLLLNAFYFRGTWLFPFSNRSTKRRHFYNENNSTSYVYTMKLKEKLPFYRSKQYNLSILELPISNNRTSMMIILPDKKFDLTEEKLKHFIRNLAPTDVEVYLPRFKIEMAFQLQDILKRLGVRKIFTTSADLSNITRDSGLFVSDMLHKTVLEVNESGIESSSISAVQIVGKNIVFIEHIFNANRPFVFIILDKPTNIILLMGNQQQCKMKSMSFGILLALATVAYSYPSSLIPGLNDYSLKVHRTLITEGTNVITSPLCYFSQLNLLYLGARNRTAQELRHSLGYDSAKVPEFQVHSFWKQLLTRLIHLHNNRYIKMANVAVVRSDFPVKESYKRNVRQYYNASVIKYNVFESQENMRSVNNFIYRDTNGKAPPVLLAPLDAYTRLALLNSAYFATEWKFRFQKVQQSSFYNRGLKAHPSHLPFLKVNGSFPYANLKVHDVSVKAVELPCEENISILFLLPNSSMEDLIKLEQRLTDKSLNKILESMKNSSVGVEIPKFKLQPGIDLMWKIQFLGVRDSFNMAANLKNISEKNGLFVSKVLHKMVLDVDNYGRRPTQAVYRIENKFVANKPFLFYVRDSVTGMILFMGRIVSLASK